MEAWSIALLNYCIVSNYFQFTLHSRAIGKASIARSNEREGSGVRVEASSIALVNYRIVSTFFITLHSIASHVRAISKASVVASN